MRARENPPGLSHGNGSDSYRCRRIGRNGRAHRDRALVGGNGTAKTQGAAERVRLSHAHLRQPLSGRPHRQLRPGDATVDDYRRLQKRIGTTRNVVVTPSTYGTDNSCTLDAMAKLGPSARGVAVVDTSVTDAELKRLNARGVRGIRFNLVDPALPPSTCSSRCRSASTISAGTSRSICSATPSSRMQTFFSGCPARSFSTIWRAIPQPAGVDHPAFAVVLKMLDQGKTW